MHKLSRLGLLGFLLGAVAWPVAAQNISGGIVSNPYIKVLSGSANAAANVTAIQAALTAARTVGPAVINLDCAAVNSASPGFINAPLVIGSNTTLDDTGCYLKSTVGNVPMLKSYAYTQAWNTLNINSSLVTTGPQSLIWSGSTPAWVTATAYVKGNYTTSNGNIYWLSSTSCTSGATAPTGIPGGSGGPTGTQGGTFNDGACLWYYVTTNGATTAGQDTVSVYWPSHGLQVSNSVWISPTPDNTGSTFQYWSGMQALGANGGYNDTAYFGVFPVTTINDTNWFTFAVHRPPGATEAIPNWTISTAVALNEIRIDPTAQNVYRVTTAGTTLGSGNGPSGTGTGISDGTAVWAYMSSIANFGQFWGSPVDIKVADQHVTIQGGGTFDYNNAGTATGVDRMIAVLDGIYKLKVDGFKGTNGQKYVIHTSGLYDFDIANVEGLAFPGGNNTDVVKIYGSAFLGRTSHISTSTNDDLTTIQTEEPSAFFQYIVSSGDVINIKSEFLNSDTGHCVMVYPSHRYFLIDDIEFSHVSCRDGVASPTRSAVMVIGQLSPGGYVGRLAINNSEVRSALPLVNFTNAGGGFTLDLLTMDSITQDVPTAGTSGQLINISGGTGITIRRIHASHLHVPIGTGNTQSTFITQNSGTATDVLDISDSDFFSPYGAIAGTAYPVYVISGTVAPTRIILRNNTFRNMIGIANIRAASEVTLRDNFASGVLHGVLINGAGLTVKLDGNNFSGMTQGLARFQSALTANVYSSGNNILPSGSILVGNPANATGSSFFNLVETPNTTALTVNSCGAGSSFGTGSNALTGTVAIPAATVACVLNLPSNAYPLVPKTCSVSVDSAISINAYCTVSWTSATSGTMTLGASANVAGVTLAYTLIP